MQKRSPKTKPKKAPKTKGGGAQKKTAAAPFDIDEAMIVRPGSLSDLILDDANANAGTKRGNDLLERSLENYGAGRSVLLDKNNRVIAGNKTVEAALAKGFGLRIVETTGSEMVAVRRSDLDLNRDKTARELAYADNRVQQADLLWDADRIIQDIDAGLQLDGFFDQAELDLFRQQLLDGTAPVSDRNRDEVDAPDSGSKVVQLFFNEHTHGEFLRAINTLAERYQTQDITSTVMVGVARQAETVLAAAAMR